MAYYPNPNLENTGCNQSLPSCSQMATCKDCRCSGLAILTQDLYKQKMQILRFRAGGDPNGWGTSIYLMPFAASLGPLNENVAVEYSDAPNITATGTYLSGVNKGQSCGWKTHFKMDPPTLGTYKLSGTMEIDGFCGTAKELNLLRLSSNYLENVKLDSQQTFTGSCAEAGISPGNPGCSKMQPGTGKTGDTVRVYVHGLKTPWTPVKQDLYVPSQDPNGHVSLLLLSSGVYDCCECCGQPPAFKCSIRVTMRGLIKETQEKIPLAVYGHWTDQQHDQYWSDNLGVEVVLDPDRSPKDISGKTLLFFYDIEAFWPHQNGFTFSATLEDPEKLVKQPGVHGWKNCIEACKGKLYDTAVYSSLFSGGSPCSCAKGGRVVHNNSDDGYVPVNTTALMKVPRDICDECHRI